MPTRRTSAAARRRKAQRREGWVFAVAIIATPILGVGLAIGTSATADSTEHFTQVELEREVDAIRDTGVTGVQAMVAAPPGDLVATSGLADLATEAPVPGDGVFRIGDVTHTFLATVVLQLVEEEQLSLDSTVERHLPGLVHGNGNNGARITVRHLLQHTSGLPGYTTDRMRSPETYEQQRDQVHQPEQFVGIALGQEPKFPPGEGWAATNTDSILLGMIIEEITGNPWYEEVETRIVEVLGLEHTTHPGDDPTLPAPHANGYQHFEPDSPPVDVTRLAAPYADGGLLSTTEDLNRFFRALIDGELLLPRELEAMKETVPATGARELWPEAAYGLGLMWRPLSCGDGYWGHAGDQPGYMTRVGVTENARRSVTVSMSSQPATVEGVKAQDAAAGELVDHALCNRR